MTNRPVHFFLLLSRFEKVKSIAEYKKKEERKAI